MIVPSSTAFFRNPRVWHFANSSVILNFKGKLQGYQRYHDLNYISTQAVPNCNYHPMGWNKKRKTVTPVWRQVSTQSGSNRECLMEDVVAEPENVASIQKGEHDDHIAAAVKAIADSTIASSVRAENEVDEAEGRNICRVGDAEKISMVSKEKHAVSVEVGASVMRFIKGKDGSTQKGIEEMGVKIIFPSSKKEDSIVIEGDSMDVISKASEKIQAAVDEAVKSPALNYFHFVSLPLAIHPELVDKLMRFQSAILGDNDPKDVDEIVDENSSEDAQDNEDKTTQPEKGPSVAGKLNIEDDTNHVKVDITNIPLVSYAVKASKPPSSSELGIDKSIFIKPERFHLTVLMLKLWNNERIHTATEVLQSVSSKINEVLDNRPLFIRLKGLDCMRGSRAKCQVLYAPIEEIGNEGRLSRLCQIIIDAYVQAGLVLEKDAVHKLKLHATVMNTTQRKRVKTSGQRNRKMKDSFDARGIFEQFGSELWGDYHIREAHLSQRFVYDDNGFYHCCTSIPFPGSSQVHESGAAQAEVAELPIADSA